MIRVAIAGAGRMGKAIAAGIDAQPDLELVGIWGRGDDLDALVRDADVVIDFSLPDGTMQVIDAVVAHGKPLVCGVSGLSEDQVIALGAQQHLGKLFLVDCLERQRPVAEHVIVHGGVKALDPHSVLTVEVIRNCGPKNVVSSTTSPTTSFT